MKKTLCLLFATICLVAFPLYGQGVTVHTEKTIATTPASITPGDLQRLAHELQARDRNIQQSLGALSDKIDRLDGKTTGFEQNRANGQKQLEKRLQDNRTDQVSLFHDVKQWISNLKTWVIVLLGGTFLCFLVCCAAVVQAVLFQRSFNKRMLEIKGMGTQKPEWTEVEMDIRDPNDVLNAKSKLHVARLSVLAEEPELFQYGKDNGLSHFVTAVKYDEGFCLPIIVDVSTEPKVVVYFSREDFKERNSSPLPIGSTWKRRYNNGLNVLGLRSAKAS